MIKINNRPRAALTAVTCALASLAPRALVAQPHLEASLQEAYLSGHRTLAFSVHAMIAAFVALRLAWRWRAAGQQGAVLRALGPGAAYGLAASSLVGLLWTLTPLASINDINALSLASFLLGALAGGLAAWATRRASAPPPARPSLEAEIARRLDLLASADKDGKDDASTDEVHQRR